MHAFAPCVNPSSNKVVHIINCSIGFLAKIYERWYGTEMRGLDSARDCEEKVYFPLLLPPYGWKL